MIDRYATRAELEAELRRAKTAVEASARGLCSICSEIRALGARWHSARQRHLLVVMHAAELAADLEREAAR